MSKKFAKAYVKGFFNKEIFIPKKIGMIIT